MKSELDLRVVVGCRGSVVCAGAWNLAGQSQQYEWLHKASAAVHDLESSTASFASSSHFHLEESAPRRGFTLKRQHHCLLRPKPLTTPRLTVVIDPSLHSERIPHTQCLPWKLRSPGPRQCA